MWRRAPQIAGNQAGKDLRGFNKNSGDYIFNEIEPEIEYGVTDCLTIGASAIIFDHHYRDVEWAPMVDTQGGPGGSFDKTQLGGIETGSKYNILSPFKDFIGLSLGFIYSVLTGLSAGWIWNQSGLLCAGPLSPEELVP